MPPSPTVMFLVGYSENIPNVAERPDRTAVQRGPVRLGGVLEELQAVPIGHRLQGRQVGGMAVQVHRHDADGPLGDRLLDGRGIEAEVPCEMSANTGVAPARATALAVPAKVNEGTITSSPAAHAAGQQPHVQTGGARADRDAGPAEPEVRSELPLELRDLRSLRQ